MPNENVHARACVVTAGVIVGYGVHWQIPAAITVAAAAGSLTGIALTPDLDLVNSLSGSGVLGKIWSAFWWPYRKLIPHRSRISHLPFIGTSIRLAYLLWLPFLFALYYDVQIPAIVWAFFAGLSMADLGHALLDISVKG